MVASEMSTVNGGWGRLCFELFEYFKVRLCHSCNLKYLRGVGGRRELTGNRLTYEYSVICVTFPLVLSFGEKII